METGQGSEWSLVQITVPTILQPLIAVLQSLYFFLERYERPTWRGVVKTHFKKLTAQHDVLLVIQASIENIRKRLLEERDP